MSLILNRHIQSLLKGYPTISDKYDVAPAVLEGDTAVEFGAPVKYGSTTGRYLPFTNADSVSELAGFVLATNVQVPSQYPAEEPRTVPAGTAFNLIFHGGIAVELDASMTDVDSIKEGASVCISLTDGTLGTSGEAIPNAVLTGVYETYETDDEGNAASYLAEIVLK